ncbi:MAG: lysylphosphatidylglycerol synthase transmembrane domain-containing protein [Nanoarchaeota archaeon]
MKNTTKNWKKFLPLIGILLFFYILIKINFVNVLEEIKKVNIYFLLITLVFLIIMLVVQTFKWHIVAVFQDIKVPFKESFKINLISNFYGLITPSKLGSVIRAEYLKKYTKNKNIGKGLFNFTIDKVLDITSVIFMAVLFSFVFKDEINLPIGFFTGLFLAFVLLTLFFIKKERSKIVLRFFYRKFINEKIKDKTKNTFNSFYEHIPKKRYFILFFLLNLISWLFIYLIYYFIGLSLGIKISFLYYMAILPLGTLVSMIPISIGGLGTREAALISLFGLFNVSSAKVFSMSVIDYFIVGVIPSIITLFLLWRNG